MSKDRFKTTYSQEYMMGSTEKVNLYCEHNHSTDFTTFYNDSGRIQTMCFQDWESGNDLWDAMQRLWMPFKDKWFGELKEGVERWDGTFPEKQEID